MSNYENLILSSYFFNHYNNFILQPLDDNIFSTSFRKEIAKQINNRLQTNRPLEVLEMEIEERITNQPQLQQEWLEIVSAMPTHSQEALREFIAILAKKRKQNIIKGIL